MIYQKNLASWGNLMLDSADVLRPDTKKNILDILNEKDLQKQCFLPVGNMRSYGDVCLNQGGVHIQMTQMNHITHFDEKNLIVTAGAGMTIAELTDFAISRKALPPVVPGTGFCTLGGALANDIHGKNHEQSGTFSAHVTAFDLMRASGEILTVTPQNNPDLFHATAGGLGLTGVILTVSVRLKPAQTPILKVKREQCKNLGHLMDKLRTKTDEYSVAWIDTLSTGQSLGRGVLETAHSVNLDIPYHKPDLAKIPFSMPSWVLNRYTVKMFNHYYYNRASACNRETFEDFRQFSFPLDGILHWNRLYGKQGFFQFQCVLPDDTAHKTLHHILTRCTQAGLSSFLAVLKKMGQQGNGLLSFPMAGFTLALDFPNKMGAIPLIKEFERLVTASGGRVYMAKDALLSDKHFAQMYPKKAEFLKIVQSVNPNMSFTSNAAKRVGLAL